ncbi:MAG: dihydrofolate reductase family protein [Coprococcus sp.]
MVAGKGFKRLRDAGIGVYTHCLKAECDAINGIFFKYIVNKQPYVTMKYAMTMDGRIATHTGASKWIPVRHQGRMSWNSKQT